MLSVRNGSIDFETSMVFDEASNTLKFIGVGELIEEGEILFTLHLKTDNLEIRKTDTSFKRRT
ncbi:MAG: hypothetical protein R2769_08590 [Saprospiraceae bacterium]